MLERINSGLAGFGGVVVVDVVPVVAAVVVVVVLEVFVVVVDADCVLVTGVVVVQATVISERVMNPAVSNIRHCPVLVDNQCFIFYSLLQLYFYIIKMGTSKGGAHKQ